MHPVPLVLIALTVAAIALAIAGRRREPRAADAQEEKRAERRFGLAVAACALILLRVVPAQMAGVCPG